MDIIEPYTPDSKMITLTNPSGYCNSVPKCGSNTPCDTTCDYNYLRFAGWQETNACISSYYSKNTVKTISKKITELTKGLDKYNRPIVVPDEQICKVMDGVYRNYTPPVGDIYSRYIVPNNEQENRVQSMIDQTIEVIVSNIRNTYGMNEWNESLSAWVQVYGNFNPQNLRAHDIIKVKGKRPAVMQFNMNY